MPLPEGWEWLDELPHWEPPQELRGPVSSVALNLAIKMLSCDILGNDVCVLIGNFITEYSLFNVWFLQDAKGSGRDTRQLLSLVSVSSEQTRLVYEAWRKFEAAVEADGPDGDVRLLIGARSDELSVSLKNAVAALKDARSDSS